MRIDELRSTLDEHGAAVDDAGTARRVEAVHGRIRAARRRRVAAAAGGTVVAVAAFALAVVPGRGTAPDLTPAQPPSAAADYAKDGVVFRGAVLGERLLGAAIGDPGQAELSFDVRVGETGLRFSPLCYGVGRGVHGQPPGRGAAALRDLVPAGPGPRPGSGRHHDRGGPAQAAPGVGRRAR